MKTDGDTNLKIIELCEVCHMFQDSDIKTASVLRSSQVFQESCGQERVRCEVSSPLILHCQDILNITGIPSSKEAGVCGPEGRITEMTISGGISQFHFSLAYHIPTLWPP